MRLLATGKRFGGFVSYEVDVTGRHSEIVLTHLMPERVPAHAIEWRQMSNCSCTCESLRDGIRCAILRVSRMCDDHHDYRKNQN